MLVLKGRGKRSFLILQKQCQKKATHKNISESASKSVPFWQRWTTAQPLTMLFNTNVIYKHQECTPAGSSGIQLASAIHISSSLLSHMGPKQTSCNSCISFIHSSLPLEDMEGYFIFIFLTTIVPSNMSPMVPVTFALPNEFRIYLSCKSQGFSIPLLYSIPPEREIS